MRNAKNHGFAEFLRSRGHPCHARGRSEFIGEYAVSHPKWSCVAPEFHAMARTGLQVAQADFNVQN